MRILDVRYSDAFRGYRGDMTAKVTINSSHLDDALVVVELMQRAGLRPIPLPKVEGQALLLQWLVRHSIKDNDKVHVLMTDLNNLLAD